MECQKSITENYVKLEALVNDLENGCLNLCTSYTHLLLHLVKCFTDQGLFFIYSQWALESKLGMARDLVLRRFSPEDADESLGPVLNGKDR